jgi:hypothetical protein
MPLGMRAAEPLGVGVAGEDAEEAPDVGVVIGGDGAELAGPSTPPPFGPGDEAMWMTKLSTPILVLTFARFVRGLRGTDSRSPASTRRASSSRKVPSTSSSRRRARERANRACGRERLIDPDLPADVRRRGIQGLPHFHAQGDRGEECVGPLQAFLIHTPYRGRGDPAHAKIGSEYERRATLNRVPASLLPHLEPRGAERRRWGQE